ncbi:MAG TPA: P1 family peptidase [Longimicrobiales bacterium]|nr:P1 family peptidase [Longimicrobiales bacterium]
MVARENDTITAVPGLSVGHAERDGTGCTVVLGPFRGAVDVRGLATGTRELETLAPTHLVPQIDAILLTGGSAFGLAAADGVMSWIAERGGGFDTGGARVPIVPGAVIFDLNEQRAAPDAALGRSACDAATNQIAQQGRVGAGRGASIGKMRGPMHADPGGVGSYALQIGPYVFGAFVVVNAVGDVLDFDNRIIAGARADNGDFIDTFKTLTTMAPVNAPLTNTTLAVVATNAPLTRIALQMMARAGSNAIVRRIAPSNTIYDGDVVFAVSTAPEFREFPPAELLAMSAATQLVLEHAIVRAARNA